VARRRGRSKHQIEACRQSVKRKHVLRARVGAAPVS
jgi:hypothetical protein